MRVDLGRRGYDIEIGVQILPEIGKRMMHLGSGRQVSLVTNPIVGRLYGSPVIKSLREAGFQVSRVTIPDGEQYKTFQWLKKIYDELISTRRERGCTLVALGGGVIGDIAGFAAATYLRGVSYVHVPTTLVAQVDASIGGKTGINHPKGKNLIGAFYQPRLVLSDIETLKTLNPRELRGGMAEVIKYGVIADADFFAFCERNLDLILSLDPSSLLHVVRRSCEIKVGVVQRDERESGVRQILNYGHTIGHALESATGYRRYRHGEAVAIGMASAARIASRIGLLADHDRKRQDDLLVRCGLPVLLPPVKVSKIMAALGRDKKIRNGKINFVLPDRRIGHVVVVPLERGEVQRILKEK